MSDRSAHPRPHGGALCRFCRGVVQNATGWPVCQGCYEDGTYYRWVVAELDAAPGDAGLLRAVAFMRNDRGLMQLLGQPDPPPGLGVTRPRPLPPLTL